jgi:hypothetical protein
MEKRHGRARSDLLIRRRGPPGLCTVRRGIAVGGLPRIDKGRVHRLTIFSAACEDLRDRPGHDREQDALECGSAARGSAYSCLDRRAEPVREDWAPRCVPPGRYPDRTVATRKPTVSLGSMNDFEVRSETLPRSFRSDARGGGVRCKERRSYRFLIPAGGGPARGRAAGQLVLEMHWLLPKNIGSGVFARRTLP